LAGVFNDDFGRCFARLGSKGFNLLDDIHALNDGAKDDVLAVEPRGLGSAQEELGAVGVGTGLAMDKTPGPVCFREKFSSSNLLP